MHDHCAFCGATNNPFHLILSEFSICQPCQDRKTVEIKGNAIKCAYCNGKGRQISDRRIPCIACGGIGIVKVENPKICSECKGNGRTKEGKLTCLKCQGYGAINGIKNE